MSGPRPRARTSRNGCAMASGRDTGEVSNAQARAVPGSRGATQARAVPRPRGATRARDASAAPTSPRDSSPAPAPDPGRLRDPRQPRRSRRLVQEAWLRLGRADAARSTTSRAWLTTVVGRLALDALGSARRGARATSASGCPSRWSRSTAEDNPTLDEAVSTALLVVLERLSPAERTAFLLHDVFDLPFEKVAGGRRPLTRRGAPARLTRARPRRGRQAALPRRRPKRSGIVARLRRRLARGRPRGAARPPRPRRDPALRRRRPRRHAAGKALLGAERIARALASASPRAADGDVRRSAGARCARVNGGARRWWSIDRYATSVVSLTIDAGRIAAVDIVRNPEKLHGLTGS